MQLAAAPSKRSVISLTPLIDIVFILLVFFMLASSFIEWQFIDLGVEESESLPVDTVKQSLIRVDLDGRYQLNGKSMALTDIVSTVRERIRRDLEHPVFVQPVDSLPLQQLVTVLDRLKNVAGAKVSLAKDLPAQ